MHVMKKMMMLVAVATLAMLSVGCGGGDSAALPDAAFSKDTVGMVLIDVAKMTDEDMKASAMRFLSALPEEAQKNATTELDEGMKKFGDMQQAAIEAGVTHLAMVMDLSPADMGEGGDPEKPRMLLLAPGKSVDDLYGLVKIISKLEGNEDADPKEVAEFTAIDGGWFHAKDKPKWGEPSGDMPATANADRAKALNKLASKGSGAVVIASMMDEGLRAKMKESVTSGQAVPMPAAPIALAAVEMNSMVVSVSMGEKPTAVASMEFTSEDAAKDFESKWNATMTMAEGALAQGIGQMKQMNVPDAPTLDDAKTLIGTLKPAVSGSTVELDLGEPFITEARKFIMFAAMGRMMPF